MRKKIFETYAMYNSRMNSQFYELARELSDKDFNADLGAFFGSVNGTLNHIAVADIIWLKRFAEHPRKYQSLEWIRTMNHPEGLNTILHDSIDRLCVLREKLDLAIIDFTHELNEGDLDISLSYRNTKGLPFVKNMGLLVLHFFNHQTHHRGQVSTLFCQLGKNIGTTDLLMEILNG